jgi:hypothetical protein
VARPPTRSDADLLALIRDLKAGNRKLTGTALREELKRRYGVRCGTQRVYRLLTAPPTPAAEIAPSEAARRIAELIAERDAALARAEIAEFRERAHQDMWANEIHDLRQQVARFRRGGPS